MTDKAQLPPPPASVKNATNRKLWEEIGVIDRPWLVPRHSGLDGTRGTERIFQNEEQLWGAMCMYLKWCEDNPVMVNSSSVFEGVSRAHKNPKMRMPTMNGLAVYLGVARQAITEWANTNSAAYKPDLAVAVTRFRDCIYDEKLCAAAAGEINAMIASRHLSLMEGVNVKNANKEDGRVVVNIKPPKDHSAALTHPQDPTGDSGWFFTQEQLDAGIPFPMGSPAEKADPDQDDGSSGESSGQED